MSTFCCVLCVFSAQLIKIHFLWGLFFSPTIERQNLLLLRYENDDYIIHDDIFAPCYLTFLDVCCCLLSKEKGRTLSYLLWKDIFRHHKVCETSKNRRVQLSSFLSNIIILCYTKDKFKKTKPKYNNPKRIRIINFS